MYIIQFNLISFRNICNVSLYVGFVMNPVGQRQMCIIHFADAVNYLIFDPMKWFWPQAKAMSDGVYWTVYTFIFGPFQTNVARTSCSGFSNFWQLSSWLQCTNYIVHFSMTGLWLMCETDIHHKLDFIEYQSKRTQRFSYPNIVILCR